MPNPVPPQFVSQIDIVPYLGGSSWGPPRATGVLCQILSAYGAGIRATSFPQVVTAEYTHVVLFQPTVDVRDNWNPFTFIESTPLGDWLAYPSGGAPNLAVSFVEHRLLGLANHHLRVYCVRRASAGVPAV
jgi:hypothetical protein